MNPNEPISQILIYLKCYDLKNTDYFSKSDPLIVVKEQDQKSKKWSQVGKTEKIMNDLNPIFTKEILIDYYFERVQQLSFEVYDVNDHDSNFKESNSDFLGQFTVSLAQLVRSGKTVEKLKKMDGRLMGSGSIEINVREVQSFREQFELDFSVTNLPKHGFIFKSKPSTRLLIQSQCQGPKWMTVFRSKAVYNSVSPKFDKFGIKMHKLTLKEGNIEEKFRICVCDANKITYEYGHVEVTIADLIEASSSKSGKSWKIGNSSHGASFVVLNQCVMKNIYTFLEYVQGGLELDFAVAIDFTASNGDPRSRESLHFLSGDGGELHNDYTNAIEAVGRVIEEYDTDKFFPVFGFGAKLPPDYSFVSHDFAVNMNAANPDCYRIDGALEAYRNCLPYLRLYGPTNFSPVIRHVYQLAKSCPLEEKKYFILLILTDGVITDLNETIEAIIDASHIPMSIIIVGVGDADFTEMNTLDSDRRLLRSVDGRRQADRDIVQFVPYNDYRKTLAKQVLEELPDQVTQFYGVRGIIPNNI